MKSISVTYTQKPIKKQSNTVMGIATTTSHVKPLSQIEKRKKSRGQIATLPFTQLPPSR